MLLPLAATAGSWIVEIRREWHNGAVVDSRVWMGAFMAGIVLLGPYVGILEVIGRQSKIRGAAAQETQHASGES